MPHAATQTVRLGIVWRPTTFFGLFPASLTARDVCRQLNVAITRRTYAQSQLERLVQAGELVKVQRGRSEVIYNKAPSLPSSSCCAE